MKILDLQGRTTWQIEQQVLNLSNESNLQHSFTQKSYLFDFCFFCFVLICEAYAAGHLQLRNGVWNYYRNINTLKMTLGKYSGQPLIKMFLLYMITLNKTAKCDMHFFWKLVKRTKTYQSTIYPDIICYKNVSNSSEEDMISLENNLLICITKLQVTVMT